MSGPPSPASAIARPHPALRPFVGSYEGYTLHADGVAHRRHVPWPNVVTIVAFDEPLRVGNANDPALTPRADFVAGLQDAYSVTEWSGASSGIQVNFTPLGARMFFGVPMHLLAHRIEGLEDVTGGMGRILAERLRDAASWDERFAILDTMIAHRLANAVPPPEDVAWAWGQLGQPDRLTPVGAIAKELGYSHRRLIARFRDHIGVSPKTADRILRFDRAETLINEGEHRWSEITAACGYYDQAHLINEFVRLSGSTPTGFVARQRADGIADI